MSPARWRVVALTTAVIAGGLCAALGASAGTTLAVGAAVGVALAALLVHRPLRAGLSRRRRNDP